MFQLRKFIFLCIECIVITHSIYINELDNIIESESPIKDIEDWQPQQIHLSFGESSDIMVVTWLTINNTGISEVLYGINNFKETEKSIPQLFIDGGSEERAMWIHRVALNSLQAAGRYIYQCGSQKGWSEIFSFKTMSVDAEQPIHVAMYGDLGTVNPQSLSRLQLETDRGMYDAIIHVGDFAYDMNSDNARVGDEFMRNIEPIAAYVPYMVCPGNHENAYNFSNYRARFSMPMYERFENMFYSWNMGLVHFIAVNTEAYYFFNYGIKPLFSLHKWLVNDLEEATRPEIRSKRPWIILYGHRPMYCSNKNFDDCTRKECFVRVGYPFLNWLGIENLLAKYGVDLAIWAHEHSYERLWPIYNYKVYNGSTTENPYDNPGSPVHVTTGSAGCRERVDNFIGNPPSWSAVRSSDYGYSRLHVLNKSHLHMEQVSDDKDGLIIDSFVLIRDKHESFVHLLHGEDES